MKKLTHYEAVQVVERHQDGRIATWWPASHEDRRRSEHEALADAVRLSKENPGFEFQAIRIEITECGPAKRKEAA